MKNLRQKIAWRKLFPAFILLVNSLTWWGIANAILTTMIADLAVSASESLMLFTLNYIGIAVSFVLGAVFFPRSRKMALAFWMLSGAVVTVFLTTVLSNGVSVNMLLSFVFGLTVGAGLPSSLSCLAASSTVEGRGLSGGITYFFVGLLSMVLVVTMLELGNVMTLVLLAAWRIVGLGLFWVSFKDQGAGEQVTPSFASILRRKELLLYLVPWIMFSLVNWMEAPLLERLFGTELHSLIGFVELAIAGVFALAGGLIADYSGRKRVIIIGFVILGLEYAVLGLMPEATFSWYLYTAFDGIAWGMFASVFFMTLWGDLAGDSQKEKYYAIGGLPYILGSYLSILVKPYVGGVPLVTAFSLASFFLFLAVLPLMYAPETLPEKKIKERELKEYVEKAKKTREKYA